jgi:hypothetical protein
LQPINKETVQEALKHFANRELYIHLETTNGAYATHLEDRPNVGVYIRNSTIRFTRGSIKGEGPFRIGLKMEHGWVYAEGLTDWELDKKGRLLLAGHDEKGRLAAAFQLSPEPF